MPRPNPPRKRPRRPAGQKNVRADAALTKQTAQSVQPKAQVSPSKAVVPAKSGGAGAASPAAAVPQVDELWSKRSYAVLIAIVAVVQLPITAIQWALEPAVTNGTPKGPLTAALAVLNPISLVVAALLAAPIARLVTKEARPLRFLETIFLGIVAYFVWIILAVAAGFLLSSTTTGTTTNPSVTPCPSTATSCSTPAASPSPSASTGASPSASPAATAPAPSTSASAEVYSAFAFIDVLALVATYYFYPPLYKRMRVRRPPPPPRQRPKRDTAKK